MAKKKNLELAEFYQRYPYPIVRDIFYDRNLLNQHCFLSGIPPIKKGRLLVAGAGTTEAITWALSCPKLKVDAIDISEASLKIAGRLAEQLGLQNLNLIHGDFEAGDGLKGKYDAISCLGVLHHLASPRKALAKLERRLKPGGVMSIMVYTHTNRRLIQDAQNVIGLLTQGLDPMAKEEAATKICTQGVVAQGRLAPTFAQAVEEQQRNPPSFADTMLNPREVSYSIPEFAALLETAGLRIVSPVHPFAWAPHGQLEAEAMARYQTLPLIEQLQISDLLKAPLCWMIVRRIKEHAEPPTDGPSFWALVPKPMDAGHYEVDALKVSAEPTAVVPQAERLDAETALISRTPNHPARFHPIALHILALVDGQRSLEEIGRLACRTEGLDFDEVRAEVGLTLNMMMSQMNMFTPTL